MSGTAGSSGRTDTAQTAAPAAAPNDSTAANNTTTTGAGGGDGVGRSKVGRRRRGFRPGVLTKLQAARLWIITNRPYYTRALLACPLIPTEARPTMTIAMDHRWRIYINEDHVEALTVEKTASTLIHEINHALRSHAERGRRTAPDELLTYWKAACELEINDDLHDDGLDVDDWLLPETFDLEDSHTAETYYRQLLDQAAILGEVPDCGPVCAAHRHPHHDDGGVDGVDVMQRWLLRQAVAKAIVEDADDVRRVPPGLRSWAQDTTGSVVDWRQVLARALRQSLHTTAGASDFTWSRPPRRHDPQDDVIRPGLAAPTADITVVLDTSGSMTPTEHAQAFSEIDAIVTKVVPGEAVRVLSVDDAINSDQRIVQARQITPQGGRGTDMAAGIEAAARTAPAAIIVITDGYTPWPQDPPLGERCVIAALTDNDCRHEVPGWIQAIDISNDIQPGPHNYR